MNPDRYISSVKRLYIALVLLALSVGYFTSYEYGRMLAIARADLLQIALAVYDLGDRLSTLRPLTEADLAQISLSARIRNDRALFKEVVEARERAVASQNGENLDANQAYIRQ
jgi:hypothetical protein